MKRMMKDDLTVLFLTVNRVPKTWAEYHRSVLIEAAGNNPIITIAKELQSWGHKNITQDGDICVNSIYKNMLIGAKLATTKYIGIAEDDTLYEQEHFNSFRPALDTFSYNLCRWQIHTWEPIYYLRHRYGNFALIAPRELMIETLEEIYDKYPKGIPDGLAGELGRVRIEKRLGITHRKNTQFETTIGIVCVHHENGLDPYEQRKVKRLGKIRAYDIPYWGRSRDLIKRFI